MPERGPSRTHYDLITNQSYQVAECSLTTLTRLGSPYVLVGGWALAAYGSPVPSVDTDMYLHRTDRDRVAAAVEDACRIPVNQPETLELLDWDDTTGVLSFDLDLGEPDLGFHPLRLFQDHPPVHRNLELPGRPPLQVSLPDPATLLFLKLCAWRGRRFYWEATRDPTVLARMDVADRNAVRAKTILHWERKAGKDLYDAAFLVEAGANAAGALSIADAWDLREPLLEALGDVPPILVAYAQDLAPEQEDRAEIRSGIQALQGLR